MSKARQQGHINLCHGVSYARALKQLPQTHKIAPFRRPGQDGNPGTSDTRLSSLALGRPPSPPSVWRAFGQRSVRAAAASAKAQVAGAFAKAGKLGRQTAAEVERRLAAGGAAARRSRHEYGGAASMFGNPLGGVGGSVSSGQPLRPIAH